MWQCVANLYTYIEHDARTVQNVWLLHAYTVINF